jgi:predicted dienelactone hydrolase
MRLKICFALATLAFSASTPTTMSYAADPDSVEAPELARRGVYAVGTEFQELKLDERIRLSPEGMKGVERSIGLRFWYPAASAAGDRAQYRHKITMPDRSSHEVVEAGVAIVDASPTGGAFPIVVISHGYGGWSEHMSRLGEHLASKGYVVVAIDHRDDPVDSVPSFLLSFGNVIVDRSQDQKAVIRKLAEPGFAKNFAALKSADPSRIALLGYSMGGFGALATAGAAYDAQSKVFANHPQPSRALSLAVDPAATAQIKALVVFAPWGSQPDNRAWSDESLAGMSKPMLLVSGDQDDVVNHKEGIGWLFAGLKSADRYHLVFREARHNIVGNPINLGESPTNEMVGYAREPVWRQERLNQINQHFVTAFLESTLKGDATARRFLEVPVPIASDGKWPTKLGELDRGAFAGDEQPGYWRGFQRRWASGLELHHKSKGQ